MLDDLLERILSADGTGKDATGKDGTGKDGARKDGAGKDGALPHVGLGMLLATAHNQSRSGMNAALRPLGIDVRGMSMLLALDLYGPSSQRRLIDLTGIDKSTMVRDIDELENAGFVTRERTPADRRAYAITLTASGRRTLAEARRTAAAEGENLFGCLTPAERTQLVSLLRRLAEHTAP